jgi:hypothetical protein
VAALDPDKAERVTRACGGYHQRRHTADKHNFIRPSLVTARQMASFMESTALGSGRSAIEQLGTAPTHLGHCTL